MKVQNAPLMWLTYYPTYYNWTIIMQLGQPQPGFASSSLALVESGRTLVGMVTCDTSRMLTLFVLVW